MVEMNKSPNRQKIRNLTKQKVDGTKCRRDKTLNEIEWDKMSHRQKMKWTKDQMERKSG